MTVHLLMSNYAKRAGGDGFYDIKRAPSTTRRAFWIIIVIVAWILVITQIVNYTIKFFSYPISTSWELQYDSQAQMPTVSICNLNPVKHDKLDDYLAGIMSDLDRNSDPTDPDMDLNDWDSFDYTDDTPMQVDLSKSFYTEYAKLSDADQRAAGHEMSDMLLECVFEGTQCYPSDFTYFHNPMYGNCFAFNAGWKRTTGGGIEMTPVKNTSRTGPADGLQIILYVEEHQYVPLIAQSTGVRVHLHDFHNIPYPETSGFTCSSGYATNLQTRKVMVTRQGKPYHALGCGTEKLTSKMEGINLKTYWPTVQYSLLACINTCFQHELVQQCQCYHPDILYDQTSTAAPCAKTDEVCVTEVMNSLRQGALSTTCQTECPAPCSDTEFDVRRTATKWPTKPYASCHTLVFQNVVFLTCLNVQEHIAANLADRNPELGGIMNSTNMRMIEENILKLNIYYERLNYEKITENANYDLKSFLSDVGAASGFWAGMSILAMIQLCELGTEIIWYWYKERKVRKDAGRRRRD